MNYVVDTSAYSAFFRGDARLKKFFKPSSNLYVPIVVIGELRAGFAAGTKADYNQKYLQQFLDQPQVTIINLSDQTTVLYGQIYAQLRSAGRPIGSNDMWVAALAMEYGHALLALDADFKHIDGLKTVNI